MVNSKKRPLISACLIARNEAENIGRWLRSVKPIADELVAVDTGSEDGTDKILRDAGAKVLYRPWDGDFSAAKNLALDNASGRWIIFMDADEYFTDESIPRLRPFIERIDGNLKISGLVCRMVNIDTDHDDMLISTMLQLRVFRHLPGIRFHGRIHEALKFPDSRKTIILDGVEIYHTGYSSHITKKKLERNLKLLKQKFADNGGEKEPVDYRYLADCYTGLGDYEKGAAYAEKAATYDDPIMKQEYGHIYDCLINAYEWGGAPEEKILDAMDRAIAACPDEPDFIMRKGIFQFDHHDYIEAEKNLATGIAAYEAHTNNAAGVADTARKFLPTTWQRMGRLYEMRGHFDEAEAAYLKALDIDRRNEDAVLGLYDALRAEGIDDTGIIGVLSSIYDRKQDAAFLSKSLSRRPASKVWLYYEQHAPVRSRVGEYMAAGRYDAAADAAGAALSRMHRLLTASGIIMGKKLSDVSAMLPPDVRNTWEENAEGSPHGVISRLMMTIADAGGKD